MLVPHPSPLPVIIIYLPLISPGYLVCDLPILGEPMMIPGVGQYISFFDTEGNRVSMLQPVPRMAVRPKSQ